MGLNTDWLGGKMNHFKSLKALLLLIMFFGIISCNKCQYRKSIKDSTNHYKESSIKNDISESSFFREPISQTHLYDEISLHINALDEFNTHAISPDENVSKSEEEYHIYLLKNLKGEEKDLLVGERQSAVIGRLTTNGKYKEDSDIDWIAAPFPGSKEYIIYVYNLSESQDHRGFFYDSKQGIIGNNKYKRFSENEKKEFNDLLGIE